MNTKQTLKIALVAGALFGATSMSAQIDQSLLKREVTDTVNVMNMDAVYNRPLLKADKVPVSVGGYMEANWQHLGEVGESEGHQFQFRRLSIFMSSAISHRIKFMTEIEFEPAEKEIGIEFAALDFEFHPLLNLRGGIILNPIGAFNQNHDGPKWEFVDRPLSSTEMLPSTWSNAGFGLFGKYYKNDWMFGYEAYLSGGFNGTIISNDQNKTYLPAAKENAERFEESASGKPLFTGKLAFRNNKIGEIGFSYMGGVYNTFFDDGNELDEERRLDVYAIDFSTQVPYIHTQITGEWAWIKVNVPETYTQQFGTRQTGGFIDFVQPVAHGNIFGWDDASVNLALRFDYVDWNDDILKETGKEISDEIWGITGGIGFRPNQQTVIRLNYKTQRRKDFFGNDKLAAPAGRIGGFSLGIATYF